MRNIRSLRNSAQFKEVYEGGRSFANKFLVIYVLPSKERKLGISVSKRVGNSVVRHRTTRLIRESFLAYKELLPDDIHMVVVARPAAKGRSLAEIEGAFYHLLKLHKLVQEEQTV